MSLTPIWPCRELSKTTRRGRSPGWSTGFPEGGSGSRWTVPSPIAAQIARASWSFPSRPANDKDHVEHEGRHEGVIEGHGHEETARAGSPSGMREGNRQEDRLSDQTPVAPDG